MRLFWIVPLLVARAAAPDAMRDGSAPPSARDVISAAVRADSVERVVVIRIGPVSLVGAAARLAHHSERDAVVPFVWPADGFITGFSVAITDSADVPLPSEELRYAGLANLGRRELLFPAYQRLLAASAETEPVRLPPVIGVPMHRGDSLAAYISLQSPRGTPVTDAYITYRLAYVPKRRFFNPLAIWPMYFEVNPKHGQSTAYDLPPGRSVRSAEFVMPVGGWLIAVGGHVRDYAHVLRLSKCANGKVLAELRARRDPAGRVIGLERFIFGFRDYGLRLEKGECYRITSIYENPTGHVVVEGGIAKMGGPFLLDDEGSWPKLDKGDPVIVADRDSL